MAYDGRGHTPTLQIMLNNHQISKKDLHVLPQACSTASMFYRKHVLPQAVSQFVSTGFTWFTTSW